VEEKPARLCKNETVVEVSLPGGKKKMSGCKGDRLRQDALKSADSAGCGRNDFMQLWPGGVENGVEVVRP
jgi:hypothetical protein